MSKIVAGVVIGLLVVAAAGSWASFAILKAHNDFEVRQFDAQRRVVSESEAYEAWQYATRYENFRSPMADSKQEPKQEHTGSTVRDVWLKAFQRTDVKRIGKSQKFGNGAYEINSVVATHDRASRSMMEFLARKNAPTNVWQSFVEGEWHHLALRCKVEKMDGPGAWIASDWQFSPITYSSDFPFVKVKGED